MKLKLKSIRQQSLDFETNHGPVRRRGRGTLGTRTRSRLNIILDSVRPFGPSLNLKLPNVVCGFDQVLERGIEDVEPAATSQADHRPIPAEPGQEGTGASRLEIASRLNRPDW
jgi:hypothetical protein